MPTIYKKIKTEELKRPPRSIVSLDIIKRAYNDVVSGNKSVRQAAKDYNIPKSTLARYVQRKAISSENKNFHSIHVSRQIFTSEEEMLLGNYLIRAADMHYGLSAEQTKQFAYQFAVGNGKTIPKTWMTNKSATCDWLRGFLNRQKNLSLRKPEATSLSRATSFNRTNVSNFFMKLRELYEKYHFRPCDIYNIDETGVHTVQNPGKIIAQKGKKQVGKITSAERGSLVTVCCAVNALGNSVPPFFIFPRVNFKQYMLKNAPVGSSGSANPSGWMNNTIFLEFMKHFSSHAKPSKESPVLVIYDNHESHISLDVINYSRENGICLLTLPPHCSNKMQPLDISVFYPFKKFYNKEADKWMLNNPGQTITIYEVSELVGKAFSPAFTSSNIETGFRKSGIYPYDENIFTDIDFLSSAVTDRPNPEINLPSQNIEAIDRSQEATATSEIDLPGPSSCNSTVISSNIRSPEVIRPFPLAAPRKKVNGGRKPGRTRILTSTPEKEEIEENLKMKLNNKCKSKETSKRLFDTKSEEPKNKKQKYQSSSSSSSEEDEDIIFEESEDSSSSESSSNESEERNLQQNDFVIVKFITENNSCEVFYIGQILSIKSGGQYSVKFLRRRGITNIFFYPMVDDIQDVGEKDILKNVKMFIPSNNNQRLRNCYSFNIKSLPVSLANLR